MWLTVKFCGTKIRTATFCYKTIFFFLNRINCNSIQQSLLDCQFRQYVLYIFVTLLTQLTLYIAELHNSIYHRQHHILVVLEPIIQQIHHSIICIILVLGAISWFIHFCSVPIFVVFIHTLTKEFNCQCYKIALNIKYKSPKK